MKGEKVLASGNIVRWERQEGLGRGALKCFVRDPVTEADLAELNALRADLMPPNANVIFSDHAETATQKQAAEARVASFLGRGSNS